VHMEGDAAGHGERLEGVLEHLRRHCTNHLPTDWGKYRVFYYFY
jgi:hypothetical protein